MHKGLTDATGLLLWPAWNQRPDPRLFPAKGDKVIAAGIPAIGRARGSLASRFNLTNEPVEKRRLQEGEKSDLSIPLPLFSDCCSAKFSSDSYGTRLLTHGFE